MPEQPAQSDLSWTEQLLQWLNSTPWFGAHLLNSWTIYQFLFIAAAFAGAYLLARWLEPKLEDRLRRVQQQPRLLRFLAVMLRRLRWIGFALFLWTIVVLLTNITWPSRAYFVQVAANLVTAWVLISIGARIIRNRTLANALAVAVWAVAAVNILGISARTAEFLDSIAFTAGDLRISLLVIGKGAILLGVLLWTAAVVADFVERRLRGSEDLNPSLQVLIAKMLKVTLIAAAILVSLSAIGIDLTALTVFSGAVGLGLGFGLQKVVSNLVSGIIILLDKSIKPGDVISLGETFGWITSLKARYVSIVTRDGVEYLIPNEDFISQQVVNWSYSDRLVRLEIKFGVSYKSDPHIVREVAVNATASVERVLENPKPVCHVTGFGDSSIDLVLRFWIKDPEGGLTNIRGEVFLGLWDAFKEQDIGIPYPHRELLVSQPLRVETISSVKD